MKEDEGRRGRSGLILLSGALGGFQLQEREEW